MGSPRQPALSAPCVALAALVSALLLSGCNPPRPTSAPRSVSSATLLVLKWKDAHLLLRSPSGVQRCVVFSADVNRCMVYRKEKANTPAVAGAPGTCSIRSLLPPQGAQVGAKAPEGFSLRCSGPGQQACESGQKTDVLAQFTVAEKLTGSERKIQGSEGEVLEVFDAPYCESSFRGATKGQSSTGKTQGTGNTPSTELPSQKR